ncbi:MAG: cysteine hydrolase [Candidatus Marinimicrobia bacterium]|nr:cysteine hydrolase [Candidatus Neomarinimicrobiota bacterium]MDA1363785.1 cysteine hydrolase [Candidatus Neomarinimicrobiota bacterium]
MDFELNKNNTGLLIIDMQNGFCHDDGSFGNKLGLDISPLKKAIDGCEKLLKEARQKNYPIAFTRYIYKEDYSDGGVLVNDLMPGLADVESLKDGTWDIEIIDELLPQEGEFIVNKNRPSAYYNTDLKEWLVGNNINQVIICGVTTSICVETSTRDLSQEDYRVIIASDAVNELEQDRHEIALKTLAFGFAWVETVDEITAKMN